MDKRMSSELTFISVAPSFITFLAAVSRCVSGNIFENLRIHSGAPSRENHTSDKNIMGHEIKLSMPVVNSSLVPLEARINPKEERLRLPIKKIKNKSRYDPSTSKEKSRSHPPQTMISVNIKRNILENICALKYSNAVSGVAFNRFRTPFFR